MNDATTLASPLLDRSPSAAPGRFVMGAGLLLLVVLLYTNAADFLMRTFGLPSLLQLVTIVLAGAAVHYRRFLSPLDRHGRRIAILFACYAALVFVSTAWARDLSLADFQAADTAKCFVAFLLIALLAATSWTALRGTLEALVAAAAALGAASIVQLRSAAHPSFGGLVSLEVGNIYGTVSQPRASGPPAGDPNFYARILLVALPIALLMALAPSGRARRPLALAAAAVIAVAMLLTYSRGAMIAAAAEILLTVVLWRARRARMLVALVAGLLVVSMLPEITQRLSTMDVLVKGDSVAHDASVDKRMLLLAAGEAMFADHPFFGVGAGNFGSWYEEYADRIGSSSPQYDDPGARQFPHSLYVQLAVENGLAGGLLFAALLVTALVSAHRTRRALLEEGQPDAAALAAGLEIALAGYAVASLFLHETSVRTLALLLALIAAASRLHRDAAAGRTMEARS